MLDYFCIFTKGGVLLWAMSFTALKGDPVNSLVRNCLLEDRTGESSFSYTSPSGGAYTLKWVLNNGLGLVFAAVYQKTLKLTYVDGLLERINKVFSQKYKPECYSYPEFDAHFQRMLRDCESKADAAASGTSSASTATAAVKRPSTPPTDGNPQEDDEDEDEEDESEISSSSRAAHLSNDAGDGDGDEDTALAATTPDESLTTEEGDADGVTTAFDAAALSKKLGKRGGPGSKTGGRGSGPASTAAISKTSKQKGKQARNWGNLTGVGGASTEDIAKLDFTDTGDGPDAAIEQIDFNKASLVDVEETIAHYDDDNDEQEMGRDAQTAAASEKKKGAGLLSSFVRSVSVRVMGTEALTRDDIAAPLADLKKKLMERNVAEEIAEKVCESVAASVEGRKLSSFTGVSAAVRDAVEDALTRILTPKRSIDILREVRAARYRGKPYVIVFVGVNGVGKSTNLAKVAYWLLQNGSKVMIAACDTFRSGAVEQLKTHCARLNVPLYERGYEKDPAKVAFEGAKAAQRAGCDVLLVDTAGRMQDNEPLMRALSNLINLNQPDLVLFVGEALVGNDAVDQLTKFNRRLADLAPGPSPHLIDGIVLTKFDTIDDKVGAALSMVYTSGAPIMFVGCGQTYVDLKKLNVKSVVHSLMK